MDLTIICLMIVLTLLIIWSVFLYIQIAGLAAWNEEVVELLRRTFKYYYKGENIEPRAVNWGIDLVWNPDNEDISNKNGFINIWYGSDSGFDTPIKDVVEADELAGKIIETVEKHLHDRDVGGEK